MLPDPLSTEHLTGSLAACITRFGAWAAPVQLRFTTKFDAVGPLLGLAHNGRTRIRFSINAAATERQEGAAPRVMARIAALRAVAGAGYPVDLTVELITHRFTPKSKGVRASWYPGSPSEMDENTRTRQPTTFGSVKWVFPKEQTARMRASPEASVARRLPTARMLYWTRPGAFPANSSDRAIVSRRRGDRSRDVAPWIATPPRAGAG